MKWFSNHALLMMLPYTNCKVDYTIIVVPIPMFTNIPWNNDEVIGYCWTLIKNWLQCFNRWSVYINFKHISQFVFNLGLSPVHMPYKIIGYDIPDHLRGAMILSSYILLFLAKLLDYHRLADYMHDFAWFNAILASLDQSPLNRGTDGKFGRRFPLLKILGTWVQSFSNSARPP